VNPRGLFITASLIVAFHPEVLTKFDRVYIVQCYYMEMEKVLERELMVKMPAPPLQTQQVPMPVCRYEVLSGGPEGPPVFFAKVGEQVYHKWTCDSTTEGQFCMTVHSCTVDDGHGDRVELLDQKGCAKDKFLLSNLDYITDLTAGKEAHVYKYADRQSMFFDCQITLTIKEPGQQFCDIPSCPDPPGFGSGAGLPRSRRSEKAADIQIRARSDEKPVAEKSFIIPSTEIRKPSWVKQNFELSEEDICMSFEGVGAVAAMNLVMLASSGLLFYNALQKAWSK
ncbi:cuticlin 1, partial [Aphelenchoides avenae]